MRIAQITAVALTLCPLLAQSPQPKGTVTGTAAEFTIPFQPPANGVWTWNRADTPDNAGEYSWTVTAQSGTAQYSFGFYLYKLPGSRATQGHIQDLLKAGQASVFKEDAEGRGEILPDAKVGVTVANSAIVVRITNPDLVHIIFRDRPDTASIHSRTPAADSRLCASLIATRSLPSQAGSGRSRTDGPITHPSYAFSRIHGVNVSPTSVPSESRNRLTV